MIDAHAGGIGVLGGLRPGEHLRQDELETRLALIGGTSSCHMAVSSEPRFIDGVWGPYFSAMIPHLWLTEGGQSANWRVDRSHRFHSCGCRGSARESQTGRRNDLRVPESLPCRPVCKQSRLRCISHARTPRRAGFSWQPLSARRSNAVRHGLRTKTLGGVGRFGETLSSHCLWHPAYC